MQAEDRMHFKDPVAHSKVCEARFEENTQQALRLLKLLPPGVGKSTFRSTYVLGREITKYEINN